MSFEIVENVRRIWKTNEGQTRASVAHNNPILGTDPDGNLFFLATPFLMGMAFSGATYAAITHSDSFDAEFEWDKMFGHMLVGGLAGSFMNFGNAQNWASNTITGAGQAFVSGGAHNIIDGNSFTDGAMSSAISGAVFGLVSSEQYQNWGAGYGWDTNKEVMTSILNTLGPDAAIRYYVKRMNYDIPADKISEGNEIMSIGDIDAPGVTYTDGKTLGIEINSKNIEELYGDKVDLLMNTVDHEYYHYKHDFPKDKDGNITWNKNRDHRNAFKYSLKQTNYNHLGKETFYKMRLTGRLVGQINYPKAWQWRRLYMGGHSLYQGLLTY